MKEAGNPVTSTSEPPAIRCANVAKVWGAGTDRAVEALKDFSLDVGRNEFVVLLGPSGCGKSTLLYLIAGLEDKRPDELSGGMRQRAAVARALAMKPSVLLMDEPFAALDVQTRSKMQDFLIKIWRDSGASVLFVTHHIDEAMALADRVVVFTARPDTIKSIVPVDLPRLRDPRDPKLHELRDHLIDLLADEVDRAIAEQEQISDKDIIRA